MTIRNIQKNITNSEYNKLKKDITKLADKLKKDPTNGEIYIKLKEMYDIIEKNEKFYT